MSATVLEYVSCSVDERSWARSAGSARCGKISHPIVLWSFWLKTLSNFKFSVPQQSFPARLWNRRGGRSLGPWVQDSSPSGHAYVCAALLTIGTPPIE